MSLWLHNTASSNPGYVAAAAGRLKSRCPHCRGELTRARIQGEQERKSTVGMDRDRFVAYRSAKTDHLHLCPQCGWWLRTRDVKFEDFENLRIGYSSHAAIGVLKSFSLQDLTTPLKELRAYLLGKYSDRFDIHPRLMEGTVESVFRSLGYETILTAYSKDGGIDVILRQGDLEIGVQVKRHRGKIGVAQIRELVGTLTLTPNLHSGIFLTVSSFTDGAKKAASEAGRLGVGVELIDADGFFEKLGLAQSNDAEETLEFARSSALNADLTLLNEASDPWTADIRQ